MESKYNSQNHGVVLIFFLLQRESKLKVDLILVNPKPDKICCILDICICSLMLTTSSIKNLCVNCVDVDVLSK